MGSLESSYLKKKRKGTALTSLKPTFLTRYNNIALQQKKTKKKFGEKRVLTANLQSKTRKQIGNFLVSLLKSILGQLKITSFEQFRAFH